MVLALLLLAIVIACTVTWISAVVSALRIPEYAYQRAGRSQGVTVALIFFTGVFGGAYYWVSIRPEVSAWITVRDASAPRPSRPEAWD